MSSLQVIASNFSLGTNPWTSCLAPLHTRQAGVGFGPEQCTGGHFNHPLDRLLHLVRADTAIAAHYVGTPLQSGFDGLL